MKIILAPYNRLWKDFFATEQQQLLSIGANIVAQVEHIGSTSVDELTAKPIIDILIGLHDFEHDAAHFTYIMCQNKYRYNNSFEEIMPFRRFFNKQIGELKFNIHAVQIGEDFWERHLLFRDYLRQNANKKAAYEQLKQTLAAQNWDNVGDYADAKTPFIRQMEAEARVYFGK